MDLRLYLSVLWRFRLLVAAGTVLAVALAILSVASVTFDGGRPRLDYREPLIYQSTTTLFVTEEGFPWGRTVVGQDALMFDRDGRITPTKPSASPGRFADLAVLYAQLATSDPVRALMARRGPISGAVTATPVASEDGTLPLISLAAAAPTPNAAVTTADRAAKALLQFIRREQVRNGIDPEDRVVVTVIQRPTPATVLVPRKLTRPVFLFLAVMTAVLGLAFVLENIRPRVRPLAAAVDAPTPARRSA